MTRDSQILEAALAGLERGWSIIPVRPRAKAPLIRWKPFESKRADARQLREWFERWPDANLAVVTGDISGLVVLDIDPRHDGDASLKRLQQQHGRLPETVRSITGGGGRHYFFKHPGREVRNRVGFEPGMDIRGDGGSIVLPPSVHPSGKRYRWSKSRGPDEHALADIPDWLLALVLDESD